MPQLRSLGLARAVDGLAGALAVAAVLAALSPRQVLGGGAAVDAAMLVRPLVVTAAAIAGCAVLGTLAPRRDTTSLPAPGALMVLVLSGVASVGVLASSGPVSSTPLPGALALLSLTACATRVVLAFLLLRELTAVRQQAMTDELTGAANRRALCAELDRLLRPRVDQRVPAASFALALIDLDHFKEVNDSFGHAAGDELLQQVVDRFAAALAALQTPHLLARIGGDEFAVVLLEAGSEQRAVACADALQDALARPVPVAGQHLHVQASIGIALVPEHASERADLLFAADAAMYAAKTSGEPVCVHAPGSVGDRRSRLEVAEDLHVALDRHELTVEYQPVVTVAGVLVGAEALVRWDHPTRGRLSPEEFLQVAERYRLTPCIAERVLQVALADLRRWRRSGLDLRISVNVSASDLRDEALVDTVATALLRHDVPPSALTVELTETVMMREPAKAQAVMQALSELGVHLSVDDYGTGYSSLEYLLTLPIDEIKIDRTFAAQLLHEPRSVAIVRSTVDLTHALGMQLVAEGVEDARTLGILRDLGCDLVQGWHLGRPMPAGAFERFVGAHHAERRLHVRRRRGELTS